MYGKCALHHACLRGHKDCVKAMLILGASPNVRDSDTGETPLHIACSKGFLDIAMIICDRDSSAIHIKDRRYEWTALHHACERGHLDVACALLDREHNPALIDAVDQDGWTAFHHACICGFEDIAFALNGRGASIHKPTNYGWTPLHVCCRRGLMEMANTLVLKGANINAKDGKGLTPLDMAHERIDARELFATSVTLNKNSRQRDKEADDIKRGYSLYIKPKKKKEEYNPDKRKSIWADESTFNLTKGDDI
jgi:ankyrin repeat protein